MDSFPYGHDDRSLAADFSLGDPRALDRVFAVVLPRMRAVAASVLHDVAPESVDDAVQTACLRAVAARERFDPSRASSLMKWLSSITFRVALDLKDAALAHPTEVLDDVDPPSDPWERAECSDAVRACFERLPRDEREALQLRHVEGLTWERAASIAGCSVDVMRGRVARAERSARALVEETHENDIAIPRTGSLDRERVRGPLMAPADRRTTMKNSKKTTVKSAQTEGPVNANEAAWNEVADEVDAVPVEFAPPPRFDVLYVAYCAQERAESWEEEGVLDRARRLPEEFDPSHIGRIERMTRAMTFAKMRQVRADATASEARADPELVQAAFDTRRRMTRAASVLFDGAPEVDEVIREVSTGKHYEELALGLDLLAELYRERDATRPREPHGCYFPDDDDKALKLAESLRRSAREKDAAAAWSRRVGQCWSLLGASYEQVRATVAWLLRDDPDVAEKTPTLTQMRRPSTKPEGDKGGETKPPEVMAEVKPDAKAEVKPDEE